MPIKGEYHDRSLSGIGGVETGEHAAQFILLGASTVQVCTGVMIHGYKLAGTLHEESRGEHAAEGTTEAEASMYIRSQVARLLGRDARSRPEHPLHGTAY